MSNLKNRPKPKQHQHASYGMLSISRSMNSNTQRLFGSSLASHYSTIHLRVRRGQWEHDLHEDRYYSVDPTLIEIEMSAAQFAEAITTLNSGTTPCTVRFFQGFVDEPPDIETEVERVKSKFKDELQDMVKVLKEQRADIEKHTTKLSEKAKGAVKVALDVMVQQLTSNIPFVLEQFNEASDRVVSAAKQEIEAFAMHALRAAGLQALADGDAPKQLAASLDTEDK